MSKADYAALIALCAALASAIGDVIRQRSAPQIVTRWEWFWAVTLAGALAVLVTVGDPDTGSSRGSLGTWAAVAVVMGPILVACVLGARIWADGPIAPVLLAVVAGSSLALFALLTKGAIGAVSGGFGAFLRAPESYCLIPAALAGMIFQQSAFRAGALTASLPTVTVAKPMVASLLGVVVLGETLNTSGPRVSTLLTAAVLVVDRDRSRLARGEAATIAAGDRAGRGPVVTNAVSSC